MEEKKLTKIERLELELKKARKAEKDRYNKSREKYRLKLGKTIDEIIGVDIDLKLWKSFIKSERDYIIANVRKKSNQQQKDDRQTSIEDFIQ